MPLKANLLDSEALKSVTVFHVSVRIPAFKKSGLAGWRKLYSHLKGHFFFQIDDVIDDIMQLTTTVGCINPEIHMPNTVSFCLFPSFREGIICHKEKIYLLLSPFLPSVYGDIGNGALKMQGGVACGFCRIKRALNSLSAIPAIGTGTSLTGIAGSPLQASWSSCIRQRIDRKHPLLPALTPPLLMLLPGLEKEEEK